LDEIEELLDSTISFYHFVDRDQNTATRGAWSSRTKRDFCRAESQGSHYDLAEAGVWAECFYTKKPSIHNDYAGLPGKRGLPDGHAPILRQLVVPTLRDGLVVAILGVGNKTTDYDQRDVELLSYLADSVWTIVENERTEEQIRQLNAQLERLAMTDELTGLANRRAFFQRGLQEVMMARRYQTALSLVMLDIDHFKAINDTYGHHLGDKVLQFVAETMQRIIREVDKLARLGGEEFAILLPNTGLIEATRLAERLRAACAIETPVIEGQRIPVTISLGVADYTAESKDIDDLLKKADAAMYRAKNQGRNQVVAHSRGDEALPGLAESRLAR
jgi:diguanylate cyclase (GGDEF)-like protein